MRWGASAAAVAILIAAVMALLTRWTITDNAMREAALAQVARAGNLTVTAVGPMTLRLLPRPVVDLDDVKIRGMAGAIALDADSLSGRLDVIDLLAGTLRLVGASFVNPTVVLDVDRLKPIAAAIYARKAVRAFDLFHTGGITFHSGVVRLVSADSRHDTTLTDLSATLEWPPDDAEASLTGVATWRGVPGEFVVDVDTPEQLLRGGQVLASVRLKSPALDLDATGTLFGSGDIQATGELTSTTPDLSDFLRTISMPAPQLAGLRQARLAGTATLSNDTLALDNVALTLDDMLFDGALAVRQRADHIQLSGTLATDRMALDPFLRAFPTLLTPDGWATAALDTAAVAYDDIDLRISASTARIGTFRVDDGSLSLQSGDGRMELSLGEARAYDGLLKGRIVATLAGSDTAVRLEATLSRLDLKSLLKDVPGRYRGTGTVTTHLAVEGRGPSPDAIVRSLDGEARLSVRDGEIGGRLLAAIVRPAAAATVVPLIGSGGAAFDAASFDMSVDHGQVILGDSTITWPTGGAAITGTATLPDRQIHLRATLDGEAGQDPAETPAAFALDGPWRDLTLKPARAQP